MWDAGWLTTVDPFLGSAIEVRLLTVRSAQAGATHSGPISSIELGGILAEELGTHSREDVRTAWDLDTETPRVLK